MGNLATKSSVAYRARLPSYNCLFLFGIRRSDLRRPGAKSNVNVQNIAQKSLPSLVILDPSIHPSDEKLAAAGGNRRASGCPIMGMTDNLISA